MICCRLPFGVNRPVRLHDYERQQQMKTLPTEATSFSQARYEPARALAEHCPSELGQAIAITGSVSRGVADRFSDIELYFWVDEQHELEAYRGWLRGQGAEVADQPEEEYIHGEALMTKSWYKGVFVEALWQPWGALKRQLEPVLTAQTTDHWQLTEAWHVADALTLREDARLSRWQEQLTHYPDALQAKLIEHAVWGWARPHWWPASIINIWPLVYRHAHLALAESLAWETEQMLRLLFAVNRQWEPDWKWLAPQSRRLALTPERLVERVNSLFVLSAPEERVNACLQLILEALALVPSAYDMTRPITQVREALHPEHVPFQ